MRRPTMMVILESILLLTSLSWAMAAVPHSLSLDWWAIDGGGGASASGNYVVHGTIGQPDAGKLSGGNYTLYSGFWRPSEAPNHAFYLPVMVLERPQIAEINGP